jgi:hypothetical protein
VRAPAAEPLASISAPRRLLRLFEDGLRRPLRREGGRWLLDSESRRQEQHEGHQAKGGEKKSVHERITAHADCKILKAAGRKRSSGFTPNEPLIAEASQTVLERMTTIGTRSSFVILRDFFLLA